MSRNQTKVGRFLVSPIEDEQSSSSGVPPAVTINEDSGYSSSSESEHNQPSPRPPSRETQLLCLSGPQASEPWRSPYFKGESIGKSVASFALQCDREDATESEVPISVLSSYQEVVCTGFSEMLNLHRTVLLDIIEKDSSGEELIRSLTESKVQLQLQLKRAQDERYKLKADARLRFPRS